MKQYSLIFLLVNSNLLRANQLVFNGEGNMANYVIHGTKAGGLLAIELIIRITYRNRDLNK